MKVQTFTVKAIVKNGSVSLTKERSLIEGTDSSPFEEKLIPKMAQEVAEFNKNESEAIKQMGDGEYTIEHKIIV